MIPQRSEALEKAQKEIGQLKDNQCLEDCPACKDILGKVTKGHKMAGGKGTWSGMASFNQSVATLCWGDKKKIIEITPLENGAHRNQTGRNGGGVGSRSAPDSA